MFKKIGLGRKKAAAEAEAAAAAAKSATPDLSQGDSGRTSQNSTPGAATPSTRHNPFATPVLSSAPTQEKDGSGYFPAVQTKSYVARRRKFVSARLKEGEYDEKPWLTGKDDPNYKRRRWEKMIFWIGIAIGVIGGAAICAFEYMGVSTGTFCPVWEDDFSSIDPASWSFEITRGGFGTGAFDWTTNDPKNAFTDAEGLHIVPTLTTESTDITPEQIYDGYTLNLTTAKTCTSEDYTMCSIYSNKTTGDIINPVRSARLTTKGKRSIQYGKVEVVAKMPKGDWLWPAIWMMPEDDMYGAWPQSGEIDIAESRGNSAENYTDGRNSIISALHWGPSPGTDAFWRTSGKHNLRRTDYSEAFHTYGLEWTPDYLFMYIDSQLLQVFFIKFAVGPRTMWKRGQFGEFLANQSALFDPWSQTGMRNTPFDQKFYLILNVAVGGTNGFFKDGISNKPWGDGSLTAPKQFWDANQLWLPSWGEGTERGMTVKSVKMFSHGAC